MNTQFLLIAEQVKLFLRPLMKASQFMAEQYDRLAKLQLGSFKVYTDLGFSQFKISLKVTNPQRMQEFMDSQFAVFSFVGHQMLDDSDQFTKWGIGCVDGAERLARKSMVDVIFKY
ncbi:MAG: hypothetical protein U1F42_05875 [Candidatus Competibacteraceae bacterium]